MGNIHTLIIYKYVLMEVYVYSVIVVFFCFFFCFCFFNLYISFLIFRYINGNFLSVFFFISHLGHFIYNQLKFTM